MDGALPFGLRPISFKELFAGLLECTAWSKVWRGNRVRRLCDNQAAVNAINIRSCWGQTTVRCLFFLEAWFEFELTATHLPGRLNTLVDDLSRNHLSHFFPRIMRQIMPQPSCSQRGQDYSGNVWDRHLLVGRRSLLLL